jgi:hypothetical protein
LYIALKTKVETIAKMTKQSIDKIESKWQINLLRCYVWNNKLL